MTRRGRLLVAVPAVLALSGSLGAQRPGSIKFARFQHVARFDRATGHLLLVDH